MQATQSQTNYAQDTGAEHGPACRLPTKSLGDSTDKWWPRKYAYVEYERYDA